MFVEVVVVSSAAAESLDPGRGLVDVVDHEVEVDAVLAHLWLRYALERHVRRARFGRREVDELRRLSEPEIDIGAEHLGPERRETLGIGAIDLDPTQPRDGRAAR